MGEVNGTKEYLETMKGQASMSNVKLGVVTSELENTKSIAARLRETIDNLKQEHGNAQDVLVQKEQEISEIKASRVQIEINEKKSIRACAELKKEKASLLAEMKQQDAKWKEKYKTATEELRKKTNS